MFVMFYIHASHVIFFLPKCACIVHESCTVPLPLLSVNLTFYSGELYCVSSIFSKLSKRASALYYINMSTTWWCAGITIHYCPIFSIIAISTCTTNYDTVTTYYKLTIIEGFQPEWCISTIYHAWDTPFWPAILDTHISSDENISLTSQQHSLS